jgi:transposase
MNTKLHAVTDANGRPISFFMTAGQVSDYIGAAALLDELPKAQWLLADRGCDADWFRDALQEKGITPCIPGRKSRNKAVKHDKRRYTRRNRIEIMFGRLKDWRRLATRFDRNAKLYGSSRALRGRHLVTVVNPDPNQESEPTVVLTSRRVCGRSDALGNDAARRSARKTANAPDDEITKRLTISSVRLVRMEKLGG